MATQYELPEPPTDVISAVKFAPHSPSRLLVSSWDRSIYLYDAPPPGSGEEGGLSLRIEHRAPVLDVCFGDDDNTAYSAGLDWDVHHVDLEKGKKTILSAHEDGVNHVVYSREHKMLVSSSWDETLHIHLLENNSQLTHMPSVIKLASKPHAIALSPSKLVVVMASRQISIYELEALRKSASEAPAQPAEASDDDLHRLEIEPWQQRESSLKQMTRGLACMPSDEGYSISSIEGRVAVDFFDASDESQARKYAFKCHRTSNEEEDIVYPVNALLWHPVRKTTFISAGGDGLVSMWDGVNKRRIKNLPSFGAGVAGVDWSSDGKLLAVGTSPTFEDGSEEVDTASVRVFVRAVADNELKSKEKK